MRVRIYVLFFACLNGLGAQPVDTLYRAKGDHERTYHFADAGIDSPYRIFVPEIWDGVKRLPLIVILHGSNLTHDAIFDREPADLKGIVKREADKHSFIVVAVEGYKGGSYGSNYPFTLTQYLHPGRGAPRGPHRPDRPVGEEIEAATAAVSPEEASHNNELAERDVINVIGIVSKEYNTDPDRLYLMGNSMGMMGTLHLAAKYPKMFAAIAPSDGPIDPTFYPYEKLKGIAGVMIVHGEDDAVAPIDDSEMIAYLLKTSGIDAIFVPVSKGGHGDSWYMKLPDTFDFFERHPRR